MLRTRRSVHESLRHPRVSPEQPIEIDRSQILHMDGRPETQTGVGSASVAHIVVPNWVNVAAAVVLSVCSLASAAV